MSRYEKQKIYYQQTFICVNCRHSVPPPESGSKHRNHCPCCLYSRHVDLRVGDRRSGCRGIMEPIGIWVRGRKEWAIIHRCSKCGIIRTNRIAGDDNEVLLFTLAARPMTMLPFPADNALENIYTNDAYGEDNGIN